MNCYGLECCRFLHQRRHRNITTILGKHGEKGRLHTHLQFHYVLHYDAIIMSMFLLLYICQRRNTIKCIYAHSGIQKHSTADIFIYIYNNIKTPLLHAYMWIRMCKHSTFFCWSDFKRFYNFILFLQFCWNIFIQAINGEHKYVYILPSSMHEDGRAKTRLSRSVATCIHTRFFIMMAIIFHIILHIAFIDRFSPSIFLVGLMCLTCNI